jgi:hypothetical protein
LYKKRILNHHGEPTTKRQPKYSKTMRFKGRILKSGASLLKKTEDKELS